MTILRISRLTPQCTSRGNSKLAPPSTRNGDQNFFAWTNNILSCHLLPKGRGRLLIRPLGLRGPRMAVWRAGSLPGCPCPEHISTNPGPRRRKVRCNEQRPRCSHCERLNLDCTWNRVPIQRDPCSTQPQTRQLDYAHLVSMPLGAFGFSQFSEGFNSTWDEAMLLSPSSWPDYSMTAPLPQDLLPQSLGGTWSPPTLANLTSAVISPDNGIAISEPHLHKERGTVATKEKHLSIEDSSASVDNEYLLNSFQQIFFPPILAPVEIGPKLSTTRAFFASMCSESFMVRLAVMAFSAFQLSRSKSGTRIDYKPLYDNASHEIYSELHRGKASLIGQRDLKHFLASLFLLTYADVSQTLTDRLL